MRAFKQQSMKAASRGARKLHRAQSAVSELSGNLEAKSSRSGRSFRNVPTLTPPGFSRSPMRAVLGKVDLLKARAKGISGGLPGVGTLGRRGRDLSDEAIAERPRNSRSDFLARRCEVREGLGGATNRARGRLSVFRRVGVFAIAAPDSMTLERLQGVHMIMVGACEHPSLC